MFLEFIIPTYNRIEHLRTILSSLIVQTDSDWSANVVIDDIENKDVIELINSLKSPKIYYTLTGKRYNDWGHTPREIGKQMSSAEYIIMTGDDNYYMPKLVEDVKAASNSKPAIIYWDMVHNHLHYHTKKHYQYWKPILAKNGIDMGSFATRRDIAQKIKLNVDDFSADGEFIEKIKTEHEQSEFVKIDKVLFVHN